jgi:hypothetical protein
LAKEKRGWKPRARTPRLHLKPWKKYALAFNFGPAAEKKVAQLVVIIPPSFTLRIQREEDFPTRSQVFLEIVEEKPPFGQSPRHCFCAIESSRESCDPIEFLTEIRQWFEWFYLPGFAFDLKKIEKLSEKWKPFQVETHAAMSKLLANEQEKTAAAAKIENVLRG